MRTFVVDTHALVWFLARDARLSERARTVLQDPAVRLIIPAIVLAEIKYLGSKGRFAQTLDEGPARDCHRPALPRVSH